MAAVAKKPGQDIKQFNYAWVGKDKTGKVIKAGTLDDTSWVAPALHIWTESAMAFTVIPEGVQSYPRNIG